MSSKAETGKPPIVNTLLLGFGHCVVARWRVGSYYYFQDLAITPVRVVGLMRSGGGCIFHRRAVRFGSAFFRFLKEADIERRKVVWPTHQETLQTALMVIIVTILISLFLAVLTGCWAPLCVLWSGVDGWLMRWYVVHAYSGFEKQVKRSLEDRIQRADMEELFRRRAGPDRRSG